MHPKSIKMIILAAFAVFGFLVLVADAGPRSCRNGSCSRATVQEFRTVQSCPGGVCTKPQAAPGYEPPVQAEPKSVMKQPVRGTVRGVGKCAKRVASAPVRLVKRLFGRR